MGNKYRGIPSLMHHTERAFFLECCKTAPPGDAVDLGAYRGASSAMICDVRGDSRVYTVDNWSRRKAGGTSMKDVASRLGGLGHKTHLLSQNSFDPPPDGIQTAILSVDTDHRGVILAQEMEAWGPTLIHGAVVLLHDCHEKDYPCLYEEIERRFVGDEWELIGQAKSLRAYRFIGGEK